MTDQFWAVAFAIFLIIATVAAYLLRRPASRSGSFASYTRDLTALAKAGKLDPFSGRDEEIERLIHIILRRTKNNPLLIGEPGVGKSAIVEGLAIRIANGDVPEPLKSKRVLSLDLAALVSDTKYRGELERRLTQLTSEVETVGKSAILFIDEIHMLEQMGKAEGALSISDVLKPALARGDLAVIGATTWSDYEKFIRPDQALDRRLQPVLVEEPSPEQSVQILKGLRSVYETFHGVTISDAAIDAAVRLSDEKIEERFLPDKAIDLIDEASSKVSIEGSCKGRAPLGLIHAASEAAGKECTVEPEDVETVVEQWVVHGQAQAERDLRAKGV